MNAFWTALVVQAVKALAGAVVWDAALEAVTALLSADLAGEEKRKLVKAKLREAFANLPSRLLNLVIEAAVLKTTPR